MGFSTKEDLAIAELAYFGLALLISLVVVIKQIFRHGGFFWIYLSLISILRIIGAGVTLYMQTQHTSSTALIMTAAICSAVGTAPLLLVLMGIIERAAKNILPSVWRPAHLITIAALILAIVGGVYESKPNPDHFKTGTYMSKASSVIFAAIFLGLGLLTLWAVVDLRRVTEKKLVVGGAFILPFMLVRVAYTVAVSFTTSDTTSLFYFRDVNIWVQLGMMFLMEVVIVSVYIVIGLFSSPKEDTPPPKQTYYTNDAPYDGRRF